jgi:hypothetical protein
MHLRILLSTRPDDDLTAENPYEVITVRRAPLTAHICYYVATAFRPSGEQRDMTTFLGHAAGYSPRRLARLALGALLQDQGKEASDAAGV